jgi:hypothetical protein
VHTPPRERERQEQMARIYKNPSLPTDRDVKAAFTPPRAREAEPQRATNTARSASAPDADRATIDPFAPAIYSSTGPAATAAAPRSWDPSRVDPAGASMTASAAAQAQHTSTRRYGDGEAKKEQKRPEFESLSLNDPVRLPRAVGGREARGESASRSSTSHTGSQELASASSQSLSLSESLSHTSDVEVSGSVPARDPQRRSTRSRTQGR